MEVEKKGGGSFPSNYLTIQQLRQRWLQQQQQSSSSLLLSPVVISESNHRDNDVDVECCAASSSSKKKPQIDAVSPPVVTKSLSYNNNNNNKASSSSSSKPNQLPTLSPITSSGASMKKPQNDAVSPLPAKAKSPPPPAKTDAKSTSSSNNNNKKPPLISEENHDNEIVSSKTLIQSVGACHYKRGGGRNPNRLLTPQKPKPEPKDTATILNTDDDSAANDDVDNHINTVGINNNKKISRKKRSQKPKGVFPDQSLVSGPETDPKLEPEVEAVVAEKEKEGRKSDKESKMVMGLEAEQVVEKKKKKKRDNKVGRDFKDKRASSFHHQNNNKNDAFAVEPEKVEMEAETVVVVVDKRQKPPREIRRRRDLDNKAVWEFKPKTTSFGQCNNNSNLVDDNVDVKAVEVDKVVGNGDVDVDVVKENSRRGSKKHHDRGQGKQTLKARSSSFDHDQDVSETTTVKESDATGDGERRVFGRFHRQGIRRPVRETGKGKVWVKKTPTPTSSFHSF